MLVQSLALLITLANAMLIRKAPRNLPPNGLRPTASGNRMVTRPRISTKPSGSAKKDNHLIINPLAFERQSKSVLTLAGAYLLVTKNSSSEDEEAETVAIDTMASTTIDDYMESWREYTILWDCIKRVPRDAKWKDSVDNIILRDHSLSFRVHAKLYEDFCRLSDKGPAAFIDGVEDSLIFSFYSKIGNNKRLYLLPHYMLPMAINVHRRRLVDVPLNDEQFMSMYTALVLLAKSADSDLPTKAELKRAISASPSLVDMDTLDHVYKLHGELDMFCTNAKLLYGEKYPKMTLNTALQLMGSRITSSKL